MSQEQRRNFMKQMAIGASASLIAGNAIAARVTPREIEGPFYPITPQDDKDMDLTQVQGKSGIAKGQIIEVFGRVVDQEMNPIKGATLDLWQANTYGKYTHPKDTSEQPLDENFQGWAVIQSGDDGRFKIKTIMPGVYAIAPKRLRTPHIHFKVNKEGFKPLTTQMYFENHPVNEIDEIIARRDPKNTELLLAKRMSKSNDAIDRYQFNIVLGPATAETQKKKS